MSDCSMTVIIKLFAAYQEAYNLPELELDFPSRTTVGEVLDYVLAQQPQLEKWRDVTRFGVNLEFVEADTILNDGDEIVFIPPVSGG